VIVESYSLFLAAQILVGGSLGDHYGRRRIILLGVRSSPWPPLFGFIRAGAFEGLGPAAPGY
jgi:MFS family permease